MCFWFGWRGANSDYRARGGFYLCVVVFIPLVLSFRWAQAGAEPRLMALGITPHPAIAEPMGLAVGLGPPPRTWVFALTGPGTAALAFYRDPAHATGWRLTTDAGNTLVFHRDGERLEISGGDQPTLIYLLSTEAASGPR